ncbi:hypothetical protein RSAG8_10134, partial [Rhizoctonia solani AG-8 WAC10335]
MSAWDDELPELPPRVEGVEGAGSRGEDIRVDTAEVVGLNPDNPTTKLGRVLMNERHAPELLPWQGQLVEDVLEKLHQQIEKYATHIMATPELQSRMSVLEQKHAISYKNLFKAHMHRTVLDNLPEGLRSLNETFPDGRSMAEYEPRNVHLRHRGLWTCSVSRWEQRQRRQGFDSYFPVRDDQASSRARRCHVYLTRAGVMTWFYRRTRIY